MSESGKRKLFGRMFGGGKPAVPAPALEEQSACEPLAGEAAPPEQAGAGQASSEPVAAEGEKEQRRPGWFQRLRQGLSRTSSRLTEGITSVFTKRKLDDETLQELEELLIQADLGLDVAVSVCVPALKKSPTTATYPLRRCALSWQEVEKVLAPVARPLKIDAAKKPHVVLMVGVNGTGKTTTIGKYASQFTQAGLKKRAPLAGDYVQGRRHRAAQDLGRAYRCRSGGGGAGRGCRGACLRRASPRH